MATRLRSASSAPGLHNNNIGSDSWASARPNSGMAPSLSLWVQLFFRSRHLQQTALTYKAHAIRVVRALAYILNIHTLLVLCVALLSVYFCLEMDIRCAAGSQGPCMQLHKQDGINPVSPTMQLSVPCSCPPCTCCNSLPHCPA